MNKKKFGLMFASAALVVSTALFGTLAYFTDRDTVTNTFTVGKIDITLDEKDVDENGKPIANAPRVDGNEYKLVPGKTYEKDPTITVKADSENAYIRMMVTFTKAAELDEIFDALAVVNEGNRVELTSIFNGYDANEWRYIGYTENAADNTITYEFRYKEMVAGDAQDRQLEPLFDSFTVPGYINAVQLQEISDMEIIVVGQAIQAESFEDEMDGQTVVKTAEQAAWEAFDKQTLLNPEPPVTTPGTGTGAGEGTGSGASTGTGEGSGTGEGNE